MSIPKEPRQLMINLMYLVLTAMLALNVSAEIFHAFKVLDEGNLASSNTVSASNDRLVRAIEQQIDAYPKYEPYRERVQRTQALRRELVEQVGQLRAELIEAAGGMQENGLPVRYKDKDISTKLLVDEGRGAELEQRVLATREHLLAQIDDPTERERLEAAIPLNIPALPAGADADDWATFTFRQIPVGAILPILSKFENDVRIAETTLLNHFFNELNVSEIKADKFAAMVSADQSYVIRGDRYRSEIFLSSYSSSADNITITVDGRALPVRDGRAVFERPAGDTGKKSHTAVITVTNPIDGSTERFERTFNYEVGERSVAVSADKMNVLYAGVDNPISISAAGIPSAEVRVGAEGTPLNKTGAGKYIARPTQPGTATITVSGGGLEPTSFPYRIKRIPDPVVKLGGKHLGGTMRIAEFRAQRGLIPVLENFDFDARCEVQGFQVTRVRKGDATNASNRGASYNDAARRLIGNSERNDIFLFDKVKARCPGDAAGRELPGLVFTLK